jgi:hypothetical protein
VSRNSVAEPMDNQISRRVRTLGSNPLRRFEGVVNFSMTQITAIIYIFIDNPKFS